MTVWGWGKRAAVATALLGCAAAGARAQSSPQPTNRSGAAPFAEYLMSRSAEIALARSAAPEAISKNATVLVLTRQGWQTAVQGSNGFVCLVERSWTSSIDFKEVWNAKIRGADCLNPAAARTMIPIFKELTRLTLAGATMRQRVEGLRAAYARKAIPALAPGALGYMMSRQSYLTDAPPHNLAHVMMFTATRGASVQWGASLPHVPLLAASNWFPTATHTRRLELSLPPLDVLVIAVPDWSDGTRAN